MNRIRVNLDRRLNASYDIHIGCHILDRVAPVLTKNGGASRWFVVTDDNVSALHGERVLGVLRESGLAVETIAFPAGEASKTIGTCVEMAGRLLESGADRTSGLIALGGGVVGDVAGFVASIYMRGIPCVQIPTTLLAQVDSSIGGKTGVDTPGGKEPAGHLPPAEGGLHRPGLPRHASGQGSSPTEWRRSSSTGSSRTPNSWRPSRKRPRPCRAGIPPSWSASSPRPAGSRRVSSRSTRRKKGCAASSTSATLSATQSRPNRNAIAHGEAVAMGMVAAALISERQRYLSAEDRERVVTAIGRAGLPVRIPAEPGYGAILSHLAADKKKAGGKIHFVLLRKPGMPFINGGVALELVQQTIEELKA